MQQEIFTRKQANTTTPSTTTNAWICTLLFTSGQTEHILGEF
jgi:hypothetical protein